MSSDAFHTALEELLSSTMPPAATSSIAASGNSDVLVPDQRLPAETSLSKVPSDLLKATIAIEGTPRLA